MKPNVIFDELNAFELPDGSKIKIEFTDVDGMKSLDIVKESKDGKYIETLCEVEYTERRGLRTIVYNGDEEYPVHFENQGYQNLNYDCNKELPF